MMKPNNQRFSQRVCFGLKWLKATQRQNANERKHAESGSLTAFQTSSFIHYHWFIPVHMQDVQCLSFYPHIYISNMKNCLIRTLKLCILLCFTEAYCRGSKHIYKGSTQNIAADTISWTHWMSCLSCCSVLRIHTVVAHQQPSPCSS